jgi:hypothetical protein
MWDVMYVPARVYVYTPFFFDLHGICFILFCFFFSRVLITFIYIYIYCRGPYYTTHSNPISGSSRDVQLRHKPQEAEPNAATWCWITIGCL